MRLPTLLLALITIKHVGAWKGLEKQCKMRTKPLPADLRNISLQRRARSIVVLSTLLEENMGVANQHSALLSLLVLAVAARIDRVLLPPSLSRSNWTRSAQWIPGPASELWDVQSVRDLLASGGVKLQVCFTAH